MIKEIEQLIVVTKNNDFINCSQGADGYEFHITKTPFDFYRLDQMEVVKNYLKSAEDYLGIECKIIKAKTIFEF